VVGAITAVSHLAPRMADAGGGTVILTGGMPEPIPDVTSLSLGKAGVRALTQILAKAYEPGGVHLATLTVAGSVSPGPPSIPTRSRRATGRSTSSPRVRGTGRCCTGSA
jgi:NAD(P)-dependent dehydrogenase (short-subunit alcohol dehydrogenase family)